MAWKSLLVSLWEAIPSLVCSNNSSNTCQILKLKQQLFHIGFHSAYQVRLGVPVTT